MTELMMLFSGIGGLSGVATLITAVANWRNTSATAAQFKNNGGSSLKDQLDRLEHGQATLERGQTRLEEEVKANTARIEATGEHAKAEHARMWRAIRNPRRRR